MTAEGHDAAIEADLMARVAAGDRGEALAGLYRRFAPRLYVLGLRRLGDRALAEELVVETFARLAKGAGDEHGEGADPRTTLLKVARSAAKDVRARGAGPSADTEAVPPPVELDRALLGVDVRETLARLPDGVREILELSTSGMRQSEIATKLGIEVEDVKTRTRGALRAATTLLEERNLV